MAKQTVKRTGKASKFDIRVDDIQKDIIIRAAELEHKTVTAFILENAFEKAQELLANQSRIYFKEDAFRSFVEELNSSGRVIEPIKELMKEKSLFGKEIHIK